MKAGNGHMPVVSDLVAHESSPNIRLQRRSHEGRQVRPWLKLGEATMSRTQQFLGSSAAFVRAPGGGSAGSLQGPSAAAAVLSPIPAETGQRYSKRSRLTVLLWPQVQNYSLTK